MTTALQKAIFCHCCRGSGWITIVTRYLPMPVSTDAGFYITAHPCRMCRYGRIA